VLAATNAVQGALAEGLTSDLVIVAVAGLVLLVGLWWTYFLEPAAEGLQRKRAWSFFWGYGHYFLFAALAAVGAALEVAVEAITHHIEIPDVVVGYALAVPVALVLVLLWVLHLPFSARAEIPPWLLLPGAAVILLVPLAVGVIGVPGVVAGVTLVVAAVVAGTTAVRRPVPEDD
jgi:low temperature requirement protein LtrA